MWHNGMSNLTPLFLVYYLLKIHYTIETAVLVLNGKYNRRILTRSDTASNFILLLSFNISQAIRRHFGSTLKFASKSSGKVHGLIQDTRQPKHKLSSAICRLHCSTCFGETGHGYNPTISEHRPDFRYHRKWK